MSQIERMFLTDEDEKAFAGSDEAAAEAVRRMASRTLVREICFGYLHKHYNPNSGG